MAQNLATAAASAVQVETTAWNGHYAAEASAGTDTPVTIAEVAREFGVTLRALRFYESKQMIAPLRAGGVRLYRRDDRARLALILTGRRLGFTLAEIRTLIAGQGVDHPLNLTREKCVAQITHLEREKRNIEVAIAELRQIYTSFYNKLAKAAAARP